MPEGDDRLDACGSEFAGHLSVLANRLFIEDPWLWLHAAPLDAEAIVVHSKFFQCGEILVKTRPGECGVLAARGDISLLGEEVPVRLKIVWRVG